MADGRDIDEAQEASNILHFRKPAQPTQTDIAQEDRLLAVFSRISHPTRRRSIIEVAENILKLGIAEDDDAPELRELAKLLLDDSLQTMMTEIQPKP